MTEVGNTGGSETGDAAALISILAAKSLTLAAAESCTAGLVADRIAQVPGASRVVWGSLVTYSIDAKVAVLGIDRELITRYGAVSRETACAMAEGALEKSGAHVAVSVTGIAGPDGDGSGQPVGTVWIGFVRRGFPAEAVCHHYEGDRGAIRNAAAADVIITLLNRLTLDK
jgi:PncC family amidohydrolase